MEIGVVSTLSIVGMVFSGLISLALPLTLAIIWKVKYKAKLSSLTVGCLTFVIFAMVLERIMHLAVFSLFPTITSNIIVYAIYGGLAAAIFEETGRFIAFKFIMKKQFDYPNAFMYGIGHGGIEAVLICTITNINNIVASVLINNGSLLTQIQALDSNTAAQTMAIYAPLWQTPAGMFFAGGVERIFAIILHLGLTLLMYAAIKNSKKSMFFLAYFIHFAVDATVVILQSYLSVALLEGVVGIFSILILVCAYKINKSNND